MRNLSIALLLLVLLALGGFFFLLPVVADWHLNAVANPPPYPVGPAARQLHQRLFVADLHNDALMWNRNPLERSWRGHSDLPRQIEGNLALQVFSTVTKSPHGLKQEHNDADGPDDITLLAISQRWPLATWNSLLERALYQAGRLREAADASAGRLVQIRSRADLEAFLKQRESDRERVAAVLAAEGLHPLEGRLENLDRLYDAGFRIGGIAHYFDNEVGGSAHGMHMGGLTPFGRQVIARMEEKHMLIDLAHASPAVVDEVLGMVKSPVLYSHGGVQGTCAGVRNLSDEQLRRIAANGGVVGIGFWDVAICGTSVEAIVKAIRYTADLIGAEHVALGSDFNGTVRTPFDTTGLPLLTEGLLAAGFDETEIAAIMGGNVRRLLLAGLPER